MLRPGRGGNQQDGGGGYYGSGGYQDSPSSGMDVGYGGGAMNPGGGGGYGYNQTHQPSSPQQRQGGYNDTSVFKDKPRRRRGSFVEILPIALKSPAVWLGFLSLILAATTYSSRSRQARFLKKVGGDAKSLDDVFAMYNSARHQVEQFQDAKSYSNRRASELEETVAKLQKEKEKLEEQLEEARDHHETITEDHHDTLDEMKDRAEIYKKMLGQVQNSTQRLAKRAVLETYGEGPHRVQFTVILPSSRKEESFTVEMAPLDLMPHAVHIFLEQVRVGLWNKGRFYVNGPHVLTCGPYLDEQLPEDTDARQVALAPFKKHNLETLAYPEYSSEHPHRKWTLGFTGRPGGPDWYINKQDNTIDHGPGGQEHHDYFDTDIVTADPCFAHVVDGFDVLERAFKEATIQTGDYKFSYEVPIQLVRANVLPDPNRAIPGANAASSEQKNDQQQQQQQQQQGQAAGQQQQQNAQVDANTGAVASGATVDTSNTPASEQNQEVNTNAAAGDPQSQTNTATGAAGSDHGEQQQPPNVGLPGERERRRRHFEHIEHMVEP